MASAIIYSITETAGVNIINVYYYIIYLLTALPQLMDTNGNIAETKLEPLMPLSEPFPVDCYSKCRK